MQEIIWYVQCYWSWVFGGFLVGVWVGIWLVTRKDEKDFMRECEAMRNYYARNYPTK